ncbi:MAG: hypothetical protein KF832_30520 [Caldilineaceae bacterium]|nr:hypothetical protein [Caldilineaceae bacterium]
MQSTFMPSTLSSSQGQQGVARLRTWCFRRARWLFWVVFVTLVSSACTPLMLTPTPMTPTPVAEELRLIVTVHYPTVAVLNRFAGELDIWEVDRAGQTFVARITLAQYDALLQEQLTVTLDCAKMRQYESTTTLAQPPIADLMATQCPSENA